MGWPRQPHLRDPAPIPLSNFLPEVSTSHGEAVHVVKEVDVAQHGHYESRTARRQARDALQSLPVWDFGILGLRVPHGPRQPRGAGRRPVVRVIRLAEEGRGVGPGHGPGGRARPRYGPTDDPTCEGRRLEKGGWREPRRGKCARTPRGACPEAQSTGVGTRALSCVPAPADTPRGGTSGTPVRSETGTG